MADDDSGQKKPKVRYYRFKNHLKRKVITPGGGVGAGILPQAAYEAAEAAFEQMAEDYPDWVQSVIGQLYDHHGHCVDTAEERAERFERLNEIARKMGSYS